ncbi:uncharacterized protein [Drosophila kikkawai]|uniref:Uncharacterized protein n=1 Tax=Drosophila kikkawai TaxID=30033 RepID=A0A6P4I5K4_DROKI|nr:uncharacterized protein LOC108071664 [Drosophila kikkawai]KAH8303105.1 hypothetical protein KR059_000190 [Drosophila kikkawai]
MLPQSMTLILILLVVIVCGLSAELPGNAYLPPPPHPKSSFSMAADESLLSALNRFLIFDNSEDFQDSQNSFARYAPVFVDYPGLQQQEYALDLPFN